MSGKRLKKNRILFVLLVLLVGCTAAAASADDAEQLKYRPGRWEYTDTVRDGEAEPQEVQLTLNLGDNGEMSLCCSGAGTGNQYTYTGTWASEFVPDAPDRLTLRFASTDHPSHMDSDYSASCVYGFYTESWVENDIWNIYLLLESSADGSISPFEELLGYDNPGFHREQQPNMRVVNCRNFVSLRSKPSVSSGRLAKVPLGALVLALPEAQEKDGFVWCTYHDVYGYILSGYLEPVE